MYLKKDWLLKLIFSIAYLLTLILKFSAKKKSFQFHRIIYDLCLIFVEYGVAHSLYKLAQERHKFHKNALPYWSGFRIDRGHKIYPFGLFYHHYNTDKKFSFNFYECNVFWFANKRSNVPINVKTHPWFVFSLLFFKRLYYQI